MGKVLITGGAGFIGTNLISALSKDKKWEVVVLDALIKQVHPIRSWSVPPNVTFIQGDICNKNILRKSLEGVSYVVHLAAETGVGQSAYKIARYVKTNEFGTAILLEEASKMRNNLDGIILASSRAVYGEGRYECRECGIVYPRPRNPENLILGIWEPLCPECQNQVKPLPAIEGQLVNPVSIYGITKYNQEQLLMQFSNTFNTPGIALRFQNVYGPGQSLNNPYTGIISIFCTRVMAGNSVLIYEDGKEKRDFVYIDDAVQSICLALRRGFSDFDVYNVGTGSGASVLEVGNILAEELKSDVPVEVVGKYRVGDIRHAWADITKIQKTFGYRPTVSIREGLKRFIAWVKEQPRPEDHYEIMEKEMVQRGLLGKTP